MSTIVEAGLIQNPTTIETILWYVEKERQEYTGVGVHWETKKIEGGGKIFGVKFYFARFAVTLSRRKIWTLLPK
jgi:hypothetical protein